MSEMPWRYIVDWMVTVFVAMCCQEEVCGQIKWGRGEVTAVEDADWASSDKPILLTSDGCIHVVDCSLQLFINVEMSLRELEGTLMIL